MKMIILKTVCFAVLFLLANSLYAETSKELLIVRSEGNYAPFEMMENNKLTGLHIDLVTAVAAKINSKVKFETVPWKRAIHKLKKGQADAMTYIMKNEEREKFAYYFEGNVISKVTNAFCVLKKNENKIEYSGDLKQLTKYKIGTIGGYHYTNEFDNASFLKKDHGAKNEEILVKKLETGRIDLALGQITLMKYITNQKGIQKSISFLKPYFPSDNIYIAFSKAKNDEELAKKFAEAMISFKNTEEYQEILKKYGID